MLKKNPLTIVIFGATGDLYQQKLAVALFNLFSTDFLPEDFTLIGFARRPLSDSDFSALTREAIVSKNKNSDSSKLDLFLKHLKYVQGDLEKLESFQNLSQNLGKFDMERNACSNKLFYLAVPPTLYNCIFHNIYKSGLSVPCASGVEDTEHAWSRILVEKPFGKDMLEAEKLDNMLGELFDESQIFRIDHYLAKDAMQQILDFRFAHGSMEHHWNSKYINKIKIIFHEDNDVAHRGAFYDGLGALRDAGQNHMLQMLALVAMERPETINSKHIHHTRFEILNKTRLKSISVRAQYEGYLHEKDVAPHSETETFFRVDLEIPTERWQGITFELESGKALSRREVLIEVFQKDAAEPFVFNISKEKPGARDAYEKVLQDAIDGDQTLFVSTQEIMAEWKLTDDIIATWQSLPLVTYKKGSHGKEIK